MGEMLEYKRPPTKKNNRGFYVRMKLVHRHGRFQLHQEKNSNLFFKYYKWILWISLSIYFFSSYFITHKPIPLYKAQYFSKSSVVSRLLFESTNSTFPQQQNNNRGIRKYSWSLFILIFQNFFNFFFLYSFVEGFEDIYLRVACKIQYGLAGQREMQQPFVCIGGSYSQSNIKQRCTDVWPLWSWFFLCTCLRVLQFQHR